MAFTLEERQALGIHGLMPGRFKTQEQQLEVCRFSVMKYQEDLNRFLYLSELQVCIKYYASSIIIRFLMLSEFSSPIIRSQPGD